MSTADDVNKERIVVGVDGSEESRAALRWAAEEATLRLADLEAVLVWERPFRWLFGPPGTAAVPGTALIDQEKVERRASEVLAETVQQTFGDDPPPALKQVVVEGNPAAVLVARSLDASMLVLAAQGHGRLGGADLGSTVQKCLRLARCNVIVIRPAREG
jgi:nucleotide-binding universal stress UspA family protein